MLMHILSPYPAHRRALTDVEKLAKSGFSGRKAVLIYAFDYETYPMESAISAFETLAIRRLKDFGSRVWAPFENLVHSVHTRGAVYAWEIA